MPQSASPGWRRLDLARPSAAVLAVVLAAATGGACASAPLVGPEPQGVEDSYHLEPQGVRVESWVDGLEAPWSLVFLPDGRALVSERPGRIRLIEDGRLAETPYAVLEAESGGVGGLIGLVLDLALGGEGGLMGLAAHPDFPRAPYVYAMYTFRDEDGVGNRVIRLRDEGQRASLDRVIVDRLPGARLHNGGRIAFGPDGMLYIAIGEQFDAERAQDRDSLAGKILRVTPEGEVPADNPFPGSMVWSYGHRNPQGLAWHPETGELFVAEHGPSGEFGLRAYDEINIVEPGANYGWPRAVGAPGEEPFVDPLLAWAEETTPPAGIAFHDGDLFVATLRSQALLRIALAPEAGGHRVTAVERWFRDAAGADRFGRLRDVVAGPDGALYVLTSNRDGRGRPRQGDDRILRLLRDG